MISFAGGEKEEGKEKGTERKRREERSETEGENGNEGKENAKMRPSNQGKIDVVNWWWGRCSEREGKGSEMLQEKKEASFAKS